MTGTCGFKLGNVVASFDDENKCVVEAVASMLEVGGCVGEIAPNKSGNICKHCVQTGSNGERNYERHIGGMSTVHVRGTSPFDVDNDAEAAAVFKFSEDVEDIHTPLEQPSNLSMGMEKLFQQ